MLTLKTKNARFEWVDDDVESVVTLSSDDDEAALVRKLKRIIALVEGEGAKPFISDWTGPVQGPEVSGGDVLPSQQPTNGWAAAYGPPAVPEHLQGEVELIQPGEEA
ncbi:hypothetical protein ACFUJU_07850 [Streptomyces sp. NPDC057235]|uniref:hypothetical protein n=1 Tax=Streptomyces sp. NPDC057235 TaxID=3346058 RepID=UPI003631578B